MGPRGLPSKLPLLAHREGSTQPASCPGPWKLLGEPFPWAASLGRPPQQAPCHGQSQLACSQPTPHHEDPQVLLEKLPAASTQLQPGPAGVLGPLHSPWTWSGTHRRPRLGPQPCWTVGSQIACPCSQLPRKNRRDGWSPRSPRVGGGQAVSALRSPAPPSAAPSAEQDEAGGGHQRELQGSCVHPESQRALCMRHPPDAFHRPLYQAR